MNRMPARPARKGARLWVLAAGALTLLGAPCASLAGTDSTHPTPAKPSSLAPRHSKSHVYGTPVSKPILHKRKKPARPKTPPTAEPIK